MATFFGTAPFLLLLNFLVKPEFLPLMSKDRTHWPRCLLWHGWLPGLSSRDSGYSLGLFLPVTLLVLALRMLFGPYPLSASSAWHPFWDQDNVQDMADDVPDRS